MGAITDATGKIRPVFPDPDCVRMKDAAHMECGVRMLVLNLSPQTFSSWVRKRRSFSMPKWGCRCIALSDQYLRLQCFDRIRSTGGPERTVGGWRSLEVHILPASLNDRRPVIFALGQSLAVSISRLRSERE